MLSTNIIYVGIIEMRKGLVLNNFFVLSIFDLHQIIHISLQHFYPNPCKHWCTGVIVVVLVKFEALKSLGD